MKLRVKLAELLHSRDLTQKQLAEMTGIRTAAISELFNNLRTSINKEHIEKIADALGIKDITELIELNEESDR